LTCVCIFFAFYVCFTDKEASLNISPETPEEKQNLCNNSVLNPLFIRLCLLYDTKCKKITFSYCYLHR